MKNVFICSFFICLLAGCTTSEYANIKDDNCIVDTVAIDLEKTVIDPYKVHHPKFWVTQFYNRRYQAWNMLSNGFKEQGTEQYINGEDTVSGFFYFGTQFEMNKALPIPNGAKKIEIDLIGLFSTLNSDKKLNSDKNINGKVLLSVIQMNGTKTVKKDIKQISTDTINTNSIITPRLKKWKISTFVDDNASQFVVDICCAEKIVYFILTDCDIRIDGRRAEDYTYKNSNTLSDSETENFLSMIEKDVSFNKKVPILGIGESSHGVHEFKKKAYSIVREQVSSGSCKLILGDIPKNLGYDINKYIQGRKDRVSFLREKEYLSYFANQDFINLLDFLREYNSKNDIKVTYAGIDVEFTKLCNVTDSGNMEPLKNIALEHMNSISKGSMPNNNLWTDYFIRNNIYDMQIARFDRDSLMAENASYLIEHLGKGTQTIIMAHLSYLAKSENISASFRQNRQLDIF